MVVWAANFIVVKDVVAILPPVGFTFLRYGLAAIALVGILRWSEGEIRLPRPETLRILVLGGLGFGLYQILWTVGLVSIPAGDSALLIAATPVFTAVIAVAIGTDTLDPAKAVGVGLSFLGVVIVIGAGVGIELSGSPIGFALTLAAALCWATYTAFGARVLRRRSPLVLTTWATIGGTLVLAPIGIGQLVAPGAFGADPDGRAPADRLRRRVLRSPRRRDRQRRRVRRCPPPRPDPDHDHPGARAGDGRGARLRLPGRADPASPRSSAAAIILLGVALTRRASQRVLARGTAA